VRIKIMNFISRYEELGQTFDFRKITLRKSLRVNTLKIKEEELKKRLLKNGIKLEKIPFVKNGYFYEAKFSLGSTPEYLQGYYYMQEAASQMPAEELDPKEGDFVLDMAASPGSKTTQIAQLMNNKGVIVALDTEKMRLQSLQNNLERLSVTNTMVLKKDARYADDLGVKFDKILLDAPCSGNFCIEPNYFSIRTLNDLHQKSKLQKELLSSAIKSLKPGGVIVYSTCSLEPEEDEMVIDWALSSHKSIEIIELKTKFGEPGATTIFGKELHPDISRTRKFWPHKTGTEGFFIAKMRKKE
jgi:tRNA (cytosine40_48-C5)-methyltransferase